MSGFMAENRVEKGKEWVWRGGQTIWHNVEYCLGLLGDESVILYSFFILGRRTPGTQSSALLGKRRFNTNLRFWPWPAKWVVLPVTEARSNFGFTLDLRFEIF